MRPGFKLMEVGVIPEDWDVEVVGGAFEIRNHLRLPISQSIRERMAGPYPYYGPTSVQGWINEYRIEGEHALIGEDGDHFLKWRDQAMTSLVTGKFNVNNHAHVVKGTKNLTAWFYWFFANRDISNYLTRQGAGRYKLTKAALLKLRCALPPLPEQRAIAAALSDVDALLGGLERLIAKKRDLKQAAMQQLLTGQTRLPGFHGDWDVKALRDIVSTPITDGPHMTPKFSAQGVPFLSVNNLVNNRLDLRALRFVSREDHLKFSKKCKPRKSDILFGKAASVGMVALIDTDMELNIWSPLALIRVGHRASETFVFYALQASNIHGQITLLTNSSSQGNMGMSDIGLLEVPLPKRDEQTAIAAVLSDMDAELSALEARRDKTRALKQGMMQELLTGRIRLVAASSNVVPVNFATKPKHAPSDPKFHNWQFNEAVVVAMLVKQFGSEQYPLGRKRCTKLGYLMHRHVERAAQGYLKKAAGPYNPAIKYKGPETIAQKNGYIRPHTSGKFSGFVAAGKIAEAEGYFDKWYGREVLAWLEQFRHQTNDELELLATVDMAIVDVKRVQAEANVAAVKSIILDHPEWETKLEREIFSDANIARAIGRVTELFAE